MTLPAGLTGINRGAFYNTALREVILPAGVASVGATTFVDGASALKLYVYEGEAFAAANNIAYEYLDHGIAYEVIDETVKTLRVTGLKDAFQSNALILPEQLGGLYRHRDCRRCV